MTASLNETAVLIFILAMRENLSLLLGLLLLGRLVALTLTLGLEVLVIDSHGLVHLGIQGSVILEAVEGLVKVQDDIWINGNVTDGIGNNGNVQVD